MELRARREAQVFQAFQKLAEGDLHFLAREDGTNAEVDAVAEGDVLRRVLSMDIEAIGIGEFGRVAVGRAEAQHRHRPLGQFDACQLGIARDYPPHVLGRRAQAQHLFHEVGNQSGLCAHCRQLIRILDEQQHSFGDRVGRGFVTRHEQLLEDR